MIIASNLLFQVYGTTKDIVLRLSMVLPEGCKSNSIIKISIPPTDMLEGNGEAKKKQSSLCGRMNNRRRSID